MAGFLGRSEPAQIDVLTGIAPGVEMFFFASFLLGTPEYPVDRIPFDRIIPLCEQGAYRAAPAHVFPFEQLPEAHRLMESNGANG
jgi:NADPH:quinone reductase-like Zn-dependent oxidoreductase